MNVIVRAFASREALSHWLAKTVPGPLCEVRFSTQRVVFGDSLTMQGVVLGRDPTPLELDRVMTSLLGYRILSLELDPSIGYSERVVEFVETLKTRMR